jgi:chemotaxis protein MotA
MGLRLVIDRQPKGDLVTALQRRIDLTQSELREHMEVMRLMTSVAPAFGMLGTLIGLLQMLRALAGAGTSELAEATAFAMLTTVYGLVFSYLLFKPLSQKLERHAERELWRMAMLADGILMVQERRHPKLIREILGEQPKAGISLETTEPEPQLATPTAAELHGVGR